jgi:hypothetical protein
MIEGPGSLEVGGVNAGLFDLDDVHSRVFSVYFAEN